MRDVTYGNIMPDLTSVLMNRRRKNVTDKRKGLFESSEPK